MHVLGPDEYRKEFVNGERQRGCFINEERPQLFICEGFTNVSSQDWEQPPYARDWIVTCNTNTIFVQSDIVLCNNHPDELENRRMTNALL